MQNGYIATIIANKMDGDQQMPWSWGKRKLQSYLPGLDTKVGVHHFAVIYCASQRTSPWPAMFQGPFCCFM